MLSGKLPKLWSLFPIIFPKLKNISWKIEINKGKRKELIPRILPPTPIQKQSKERAIPKIRASLLSIELEASKSKEVEDNPLLWMDWKHIRTPIPIKIEFPISLATKSEKIFFIISPNQTDTSEIEKEMVNNTILPQYEIFVFLIPYVIPIPRESILLESDKISELVNIKTPPKISYAHFIKMS